MSSLHIRPRFTQHLNMAPEEICDLMKNKFGEDQRCSGACYPTFVELRVPEKDQHFWSPQLMLNFEKETDGTRIEGVYGPAKNVWSLFLWAYMLLGLASMWIIIQSTVRWTLGMPGIYWMLAITGGLAVGVYFFAQFGQKVGAEQMFTLHHYWEDAIGERPRLH